MNVSFLSETAKVWFMIFQKFIEMIRANAVMFVNRSEYTIPKNSRYVVQRFCSMLIKLRELQEVSISFRLSVSLKRTQPKRTKKIYNNKNGWYVKGSVRVTSFVIEVLIC